jgi:hypothetical protein
MIMSEAHIPNKYKYKIGKPKATYSLSTNERIGKLSKKINMTAVITSLLDLSLAILTLIL